MLRWTLLGILVIVASWGGRTLVQRQRQAAAQQREAESAAVYQKATQAFYDGDYATAEKVLTEILPSVEKSYPNSRRLAELLSMLGTSYRVEHKYDQAEPILKRSVEVYDTISPPDALGKERTESNLAGIYLDRKDFVSADKYLSDAVSLSEKTTPFPSYECGNALMNLGYVRLVKTVIRKPRNC